MSLYHIKMHIKRIKPIKRVYDELFKARRNEQEEQRKRAALANEGMPMVGALEEILSKTPYTYFLTFGNLLGLVREGHFLAHDNDLDYAICIDDGPVWQGLEEHLTAEGFTKTRQFLMDGEVQEQTYRRGELTVDFFGYKNNEQETVWHGFFRKDDYIYNDRYEMHVRESYFAPIKAVHRVEYEGVLMTVPTEPEPFLESVYGPGWRVPDPAWTDDMGGNRVVLDKLGRLDPCKD